MAKHTEFFIILGLGIATFALILFTVLERVPVTHFLN